MAINATGSPAGVNVNVAGAVQIDGQNLLTTSGNCNTNPSLAGSFEVENGCFYYCDGRYRQAFNVAFNEIDNPANPNVDTCGTLGRCEFDGIKLRPGDEVTGYTVERSKDCSSASVRKDIECYPDGHFGTGGVDDVFKYAYCMPWDDTSTGIIADYNPTKK